MAKAKRGRIPSRVRADVLREFHHLCAMCGQHNPQLHHINGNPSDDRPENLLPLCPNHHLTDQHNPTAPVDPAKLALFRQFKDPVILTPQFEPLFRRMRFLDDLNAISDVATIKAKIQELVAFVRVLEMGQFYADRIADVMKAEPFTEVLAFGAPGADVGRRNQAIENLNYRVRLQDVRMKAIELVVELLRYQNWPVPTPDSKR